MDSEYMSLMKELGEDAPGGGGGNATQSFQRRPFGRGGAVGGFGGTGGGYRPQGGFSNNSWTPYGLPPFFFLSFLFFFFSFSFLFLFLFFAFFTIPYLLVRQYDLYVDTAIQCIVKV